jgi:hypothetical protein
VDDLREVFSQTESGKRDPGQGAAIMRRLIENAKLVEMWK